MVSLSDCECCLGLLHHARADVNGSFQVYDAMECLRWSSLVPQGQCLLAPLILVIVDTSKFYDYLVKMIFKLHGQLPPDALEGHRTRFRVTSTSLDQF